MKSIYEFLVFDRNYHWDGPDAELYFATSDFEEAKDVANQIGVWFVVVRIDPDTGREDLVFDARENLGLELAP